MSDTCPRLNAFYDEVKKSGIFINNRYRLHLELPSGGYLRSAFDQARSEWLVEDQGEYNESGAFDDFKAVTIWAEGAKLPNRTQNTVEFKYQGYPIQYPTNFTYEQEIDIVFRSQENLTYRNAFLAWQDAMSADDFRNDKSWGVAGGGVKNISEAKAYITVFDQSMRKALQTYHLEGFFPTNVGNIELTNDEPQIAQYTVQFKCQFWHVTPGNIDNA